MAGQENQQYTVLYGRLSQEDERAGESNSIQHHGDFVPAELSQAVCSPSDSFCDLQVY